ncbi:MAG: TSUP family transporter [Clostridia bacterium]|nr:TSUP family transporter [Clostridia bacterium]
MKKKGAASLVTGFFAGLINGLLGAGGGILLVRGADKVLPNEYRDGRDVFANALCVMLPLSAVSAIAYVLRGSVHGLEFAPFILPALLGGIGGGLLLAVIDTRLLRLIFSALVVWSGISMLI